MRRRREVERKNDPTGLRWDGKKGEIKIQKEETSQYGNLHVWASVVLQQEMQMSI